MACPAGPSPATATFSVRGMIFSRRAVPGVSQRSTSSVGTSCSGFVAMIAVAAIGRSVV